MRQQSVANQSVSNMKTENNQEVAIIRNVDTLERLCAFNGETITTMADMTNQEAASLGASLVVRGEQTKSRGVFVIAKRLSTFSKAEDVESFKQAVKAQFEQAQVETAMAAALALKYPSDKAKAAALEKAKSQAKEDAAKRYDNTLQTVRAAKWMLENPKKVADSVSVFTVQQALGPVTKEEHPAKAKVLALLSKPGTSQAAIKAVIAKANDDAKTAAAPKDTRSDEQKKKDAICSMGRDLVHRIISATALWDKLRDDGVKVEEIRGLALDPVHPEKGSLAKAIGELAILAGLELATKVQAPRIVNAPAPVVVK